MTFLISKVMQRVKSIFSPTFSGVSFKKDQQLKFFYFPTTLSGSSHRYGPYRDTADELYIRWQRALFQLLVEWLR